MTGISRALAAAALLCLLPASALLAQGGRLVECRIESEGKVVVKEKCRFVAEAGGTFTLQSANARRPLFGSIQMVTVAVVSPGLAEVRGLPTDGINSRWGEARRSSRDRACWEGADFRICAR